MIKNYLSRFKNNFLLIETGKMGFGGFLCSENIFKFFQDYFFYGWYFAFYGKPRCVFMPAAAQGFGNGPHIDLLAGAQGNRTFVCFFLAN